MSGNKSKIIAFNYFGGKFSHLDTLYQYFPSDFTHLVDLFAGSFAVSLNYTGNVLKTANEINEEVTNFFMVLRDHKKELINALQLTPCSLSEYNNCWDITGHPIERARRFYVRSRQSFFGLGMQRKSKGWHMATRNINCQAGETVSRWKNGIPKLEEVAKRIAENYQITNLSAFDCIKKLDFPEVFFYCDPPYPNSCRKSQKDYRFEFTDEDHIALAKSLYKIKGKAMISSYENDLYEELFTARGWNKIKFAPKKNNIRTGIVQECIWFNYSIEQTRAGQSSLFNITENI